MNKKSEIWKGIISAIQKKINNFLTQAMFFADQLLSRMPNNSQVLHDLNTSERDNTLMPLGALKKVPANKVY